ncbi:MAG TPA: hypothetical protein VIF62_18565, partial [Labilithrix sp.]
MAAACLRGQIAAVGSVDAGGVRDAASLADVMASADASICVPGTRDPSFGVDGVIVLPARDTAVRCAALDRAGRLYVVRDDVERYTAAGVADGSWNPPEPASVHACVVDARNGLLVGTCSSTGCNRIRRLSADGTWDTSWGDGG